MWLAAAIIAFTEGGAEGGAIARPPGVSSARGTAAPAGAAPRPRSPPIASAPIATEMVMPLRMKAMHRQGRPPALAARLLSPADGAVWRAAARPRPGRARPGSRAA